MSVMLTRRMFVLAIPFVAAGCTMTQKVASIKPGKREVPQYYMK